MLVHGDSQLVINQVQHIYQCKAVHLQPLCQKTETLMAGFEECRLEHVLRHMNKNADALANRAMDTQESFDLFL